MEQPQYIPEQERFNYAESDDSMARIATLLRHSDPREIIDLLENELKGVIASREDETKFIQKYKPYMNDDGISACMKLVRSRVSRVMNISNYDEESLNNSLLRLVRNLSREIMVNYEKYGIDKIQASSVVDVITTYAQAEMRQSLMSERKVPLPLIRALTTTHRSTESLNFRPQQQEEKPRRFSLFGR